MFDPMARAGLVARLGTLTAEHRPRWGRMTVDQMLLHVAAALRMTFGDLPTAPKPGPFRRWPLRPLIVYLLPWPRGAPTAPELLPGAPTSIEAERGDVVNLIGRFDAIDARGPWPEHPAFGRLSGRAWGVLAWRHLDHHFRQFGI